MTPNQRSMARHALGLPNRKNTSNRNHYCIGPGGDGYEDWLAMVQSGDALRLVGPHWGGDDMFFLTLQGALAVREVKEHISREDAREMRGREGAWCAATEA